MQRPLEIVIEFPASLGLARLAAQQHENPAIDELLDDAERAGITAALRRLQADGGYIKTAGQSYRKSDLSVRVVRHAVAGGDALRPPHAHVLVEPVTAGGDQVYLPAVARAATGAQHAAVSAMAEHLLDADIEVEISRTPAGRELSAFSRHARQLPRVMDCPPVEPVVQQLRPLDRYDDAARTA